MQIRPGFPISFRLQSTLQFWALKKNLFQIILCIVLKCKSSKSISSTEFLVEQQTILFSHPSNKRVIVLNWVKHEWEQDVCSGKSSLEGIAQIPHSSPTLILSPQPFSISLIQNFQQVRTKKIHQRSKSRARHIKQKVWQKTHTTEPQERYGKKTHLTFARKDYSQWKYISFLFRKVKTVQREVVVRLITFRSDWSYFRKFRVIGLIILKCAKMTFCRTWKIWPGIFG